MLWEVPWASAECRPGVSAGSAGYALGEAVQRQTGRKSKKTMRILVYGMSDGNMGGIETYLTQMNRFMRNGTIFDYVIEGTSCLYEKPIKEQGGRVYYITKKRVSVIKNLLDNRKLLKQLRREIAAVYFNLITLSWIEPIRIALSYGYPVYVHSHISESAAKDAVHRAIYRINKARLSKMRVHRLTCSDKAKDFLFNSRDEVEMISNAVDLNRFRYREEYRNDVRRDLHISQQTKVIGFVGRIDKQKNPLFVPELAKLMLSRVEDFKLLIIGDGPLKDSLKARISEYGLSDCCVLLGNQRDVYKYYSAMDVFLLPSFYEGLPIVLIEAQANGLTCIVSETISEQADITGKVSFVSLHDISSWADAIAEAAAKEDPDRSKWTERLENTRFNIEKEAVRLEHVLTGC